jgi:hypothetical protein
VRAEIDSPERIPRGKSAGLALAEGCHGTKWEDQQQLLDRPGGTMAGAQRDGADATLGQLFASASQDISALVRNEIELAKAEVRYDVQHAGMGAAMFGAAAVFLSVAVVIASIAAAHGLHALGLTFGWSYLIVMGAYLLIAVILMLVGRRAVRRVGPPERTIRTTKANVAMLRSRGTPGQ